VAIAHARPARAADDGQMPPPVCVLVVEAGFAVGAAVERRLHEVATVQRTDGRDLASGARDAHAFDLVVLCPYLPAGILAEIVVSLRASEPPPALVALEDAASGPRLELLIDAPAASTDVTAVLDRLEARR
jgi:hypothetical protein